MVWGWKLSKKVGKSGFELSGIVKSDIDSFLYGCTTNLWVNISS